jgi:hypothetical protein
MEQRLGVVLQVAHRTLSGVHRTLSGVQAEHPPNWPVSGFLETRSAIIHQTVRCALDMSGEPTEQRSDAPTIDCKK